MGEYVSFAYGLQVSIMAILIVFILLYVIALILEGFGIIFRKIENKNIHNNEKKKEKILDKKIENKTILSAEEIEKDPDAIAAMIVATLEIAGENDINNYRIVSIKRV